jgi:hypothetical protein
VRTDNEKNAFLCIKMIIDIVPHQTNVLGDDKFQPSLALIQHILYQIQWVVVGPHHSKPGISPPGSSENSPRPDSSVASISDIGLGLQLQTLPLLQAMASLKVLAEYPIIAESKVQVYKSLVLMDIKRFFLFIESVLLLQAKPQEQEHAAAAAKGTIFTGVSPNIHSRPAFGEFIRTQVQALFALAYLLPDSGLSELTELEKFLPLLPRIIIRLLKDCPREKSDVRGEILRATRHIINCSFRSIFSKYIDEFLDERILIGDGLTDYETLRPLAYSVLADLIRHVRDILEPSQIRKIINVYTKNLRDNFPGTNLQTMSARLLLNMAECIAKMPNKVDARHYLIMILNAIGDKFAILNRQYPNAVKLSKLYAQQSINGIPDNYLADKNHLPDWDEIDIFTATPIKTSNPRDRGADPVADIKFLFKNLINGLKDIFHQLKACQLGSSIRFTVEEVQVLIKLFREGAYVFRYYEIGKSVTESNALELVAKRSISSTKEEKDLLEAFVAVLEMDPTTSYETFYDQIPIALDRFPQLSKILPKLIQKHKQMIRIERVFNTGVEKWFDDLNHSNVEEVHDWGQIYTFEKIDDGSDLEKLALLNQLQERKVQLTRNRPIQAALNGVIWHVKKFGFAVASRFCIKSSARVIIDVKKEVLKTRVRLSQKYAAMPGFYMEPFVEIAIDGVQRVEEMVHRTRNSTFRALLYKYLNLYCGEFWTLLLKKIEEPKYGRFFAQILENLDSGPLRKVVGVERLIEISGDMGVINGARHTAVINSILIMHSLCKFGEDREWMENKEITIWLKIVGKNLEAHLRYNTLPPHLRLAAEQASEQLMVILTKFLEYHPTDLDALFSLIDSVTNEDFSPTHPLFKYIYDHIIYSNSIEYRKSIVLRSLEVCASKSASQKTKSFVLHNIVNPIIAMDVMRPSKQTGTKNPCLIDNAVIESIHTKIWKAGMGNPNDDLTRPGVGHTRMELLQLTAMLVKYYHSDLQDTRQDIIKFGLTRLEDVVCKHAANVVLGYCIAHFETPTRTIRQVYTSLLGSSHEVPALVTQALELIAPVLSKLCNAVPNDRDPFWVAIPRKILEGKNVQQTTTVFHFLVKHADLFYEDRKGFIVHIVKSLRTIAQPPNPSTKRRQLVLQLMTLVLQWEKESVEGKKLSGTEKHKFENSGEKLSLL